MGNSLLVVEGIHDAAFFGLLLKEIDFEKVEDIDKIPAIWDRLIPRSFPPKGKLDHVVHYPDIFVAKNRSASVAVLVGRGISEIKSELKAAIGILPLEDLNAVAICVDADESFAKGFTEAQTILSEVTVWAVEEGLLDAPLIVPASPEKFGHSTTRLGAFVFPNNRDVGALETTLLLLAEDRYGPLAEASRKLVKQIDDEQDKADTDLKRFRKGGNRLKTHVAIISNFLRPGSNLAVSVDQCEWLPKGDHHALEKVRAFVKELAA